MNNNRKQAGKGRYSSGRNSNSGHGTYTGRDNSSGRGNGTKGTYHRRKEGDRFRSKETGSENGDYKGKTSRRQHSGDNSAYQTGQYREKRKFNNDPGYNNDRYNQDNMGYNEKGRREGNKGYSKSRREDDNGSRGKREDYVRYTKENKGYGSKSGGDRFNGKDRHAYRPRLERSAGKTEKSGFHQSDKNNAKSSSDEIRLNRYIANSGVCSRREADELIRRGEISVNGEQITELGVKVAKKDTVVYKGKRLVPEHKVYILMNKPKGYVTTVDDPHAEHTVIELLGDNFPERVYPVGRLDKDTTGVLLLTNDGDMTKKLTHPSFERRKIYHVFLDREISKNDVFNLAEGIDVDGEKVAADAVSCPDPDDRTQFGIEIHSGQNRIIRKMMESLGYKVKKLDRVYFAGLTKKNVQRGKWRFLSDKEIIMLKRGSF